MRLPEEKLHHLRDLIAQWISRKSGSMLSLIGELAHTAKVVIPGRIFLRRMIDRAHSRRKLEHWIRLDEEFKFDLYWWHAYLEHWNGASLLASYVFHPHASMGVWRYLRSGLVPVHMVRAVGPSEHHQKVVPIVTAVAI
jgi:hypothetical protein